MKKGFVLLTAILLLGLCACQQEVPVQALPPTTVETATETLPSATVVPETAVPETVTAVIPEPADSDFVLVTDYLPEVLVELKYATEDNFTGQKIYTFQNAYLRYGTVKKLAAVQKDLEELGWGLKIWDAYRPVSAQFDLWEACPNSAYVANPNTGHSSHSRGNTVDITLVDGEGKELEMPTGFDSFSALADREYSDCTAAAANNAEILQILMEKHGFTGYFKEWWHYSDTNGYTVEETFLPKS